MIFCFAVHNPAPLPAGQSLVEQRGPVKQSEEDPSW